MVVGNCAVLGRLLAVRCGFCFFNLVYNMRVGARILEVCEILEELGPLFSGDIAKAMALTENGTNSNAGKYCSRAVKMGLATVVKAQGGYNYNIYTVCENWRDSIKPKNTRKAQPAPVRKGMFSFVSSIFQVGA